MTQHPITPPPELVEQWKTEARSQDYCSITEQVAFHAAQWGADQELEATLSWLVLNGHGELCHKIRSARRPKPLTLKEEALEELDAAILRGDCFSTSPARDIIRRALKSIPDPS